MTSTPATFTTLLTPTGPCQDCPPPAPAPGTRPGTVVRHDCGRAWVLRRYVEVIAYCYERTTDTWERDELLDGPDTRPAAT